MKTDPLVTLVVLLARRDYRLIRELEAAIDRDRLAVYVATVKARVALDVPYYANTERKRRRR